MRLGVYGGSFDPVHYGHLLLAETCREECALDRVWFVPAAQPPHKVHRQLAPADDRVEMLKLATAGHEAFEVSRLELDRTGMSFTVDTLREIHQAHPDWELFFLLGSDSLADLPTWRQPERICELATPVVVTRPGHTSPDWAPLEKLLAAHGVSFHRRQVEMPEVSFSSTDVRQRVAAGRSIRYRTPRAVEKYIETHGLYR
jgi:nicotinate-nucleotide adenylyltransferase